MKEKAIFNWSSGKDSALCLYKIIQEQQYEILCLLTSVNELYQRISMHGVRTELLEAQAENIGFPLIKIQVPEMPTMEAYEKAMTAALIDLKAKGVTASVFGDINLEDLREYRENKLSELGLKGVFPLWKRSTNQLIREFINLDFKAIVTCVNEKYLDKSFTGRVIDYNFLKDLPDNVDPCGENGEFHTFVYDGPIFRQPVIFNKGEIVYRKYVPIKQDSCSTYKFNTIDTNDTDSPFDYGFWYCDLLHQ